MYPRARHPPTACVPPWGEQKTPPAAGSIDAAQLSAGRKPLLDGSRCARRKHDGPACWLAAKGFVSALALWAVALAVANPCAAAARGVRLPQTGRGCDQGEPSFLSRRHRSDARASLDSDLAQRRSGAITKSARLPLKHGLQSAACVTMEQLRKLVWRGVHCPCVQKLVLGLADSTSLLSSELADTGRQIATVADRRMWGGMRGEAPGNVEACTQRALRAKQECEHSGGQHANTQVTTSIPDVSR